MIIIDSDILIWLLRGDKKIKEEFKKTAEEESGLFCITPIQISEVLAGLREKERDRTELFLDSFNILDIDYKIGKIAGGFMNKYQKSHGIMIADALISACVAQYNTKLWTKNKKHYPMLGKKDFKQKN